MRKICHQKPLLGQQVNWTHPLARGLVGCWVINEGSGSSLLDLTNNNNGDITYGDWGSGDEGFVLKDTDRIWVSMGNSDLFDVADHTIVCKMRADTTDRKALVGKGPASLGNCSYGLWLNATTLELYWYQNVTGHENVLSGLDATVGSWYFCAVAVEDVSNVLRFRLNDLTSVKTKPDTIVPNASDFHVGYDNSTQYKFNGEIEFLYFWNRALSAEEMARLYREPYAMFEWPRMWAVVAAPTSLPPTSLPPTSLPPTSLPPTSLPPTSLPPTSLPPTSLPPTSLAPTSLPPTSLPPTTPVVTTLAPLTTIGPTTLAPTPAPTTPSPFPFLRRGHNFLGVSVRPKWH